MTKKISLLLLVLLSALTFAQKSLSGTVRDADGPVPSASITLSEPGKDAIIAYTISNSKGEYKLNFSSAEPQVEMKVKAFNHKTTTKTLNNDSQTQNITLETEATEIKEVKIQTRLITKKGDTISYDLKAFESKSDRTVADVLRKIPGIEVNKDGTVLYQGEAINKFYVNGKDLMEGGYGAINNSLPKDAVQKVEVLENHQPVKILQDKVPSQQAAINIKLKNKVTMTGRGEAGAGFSPLLWNLKLTPMFFGQKSQWVANYKTNNTGETVENEGNMLAFGNRWEGRRVQAGQNDWLNVDAASTPGLPEKRYLFNNVHYLSANYLTSPFKNKEWELKASANYTNNTVKRESYSQTNDFQSGLSYYSDIANRFFTNKAKAELIFTKNTEKGFFKNTTTFSQFWNADRAATDVNDKVYGLRNAAEAVESPTTNFQNSLSTIIPWKEKMLNFMSYLHYQTDRQTLEISPASAAKIPQPVATAAAGQVLLFDFGPVDRILQNFKMKTFEANHSANLSLMKGGWTFTPEVGLNYQTNSMSSLLAGISASGERGYGDAFRNDLKYTNTVPYASLGVNYKSDAWSLYSGFPLNFNHISVRDGVRSLDKNLNKMSFEPNFFLQYSFASFWKASLNGSMGYSFGDINDVYAGNILTSPTGFSSMSMENPVVQSNSKSAGARVEYRNPLNNLFFNVGYRLSRNTRNLTANIITQGLGASSVQYLLRDYNTDSGTLSAEVGKYFPKFKTNASVGYSNGTTNGEQMRNSVLADLRNNTQNFSFKLNNTYFSWMSVDYNMSLGRTRQRVAGTSYSPSRSYSHNLAAYFYPLENHTIGLFWDELDSGNTEQMYHNGFYDVSYQYTWAKKKIDFEIKWLNIANRKVFERYSLSAYTESFSRIQLRPSQFMLTVKFNFK